MVVTTYKEILLLYLWHLKLITIKRDIVLQPNGFLTRWMPWTPASKEKKKKGIWRVSMYLCLLEEITSDRGALRTSCTPQWDWILIYVTSVLFTLQLCTEVHKEQKQDRFSPKMPPSQCNDGLVMDFSWAGKLQFHVCFQSFLSAFVSLVIQKISLHQMVLACLKGFCLGLQKVSLELGHRDEAPALILIHWTLLLHLTRWFFFNRISQQIKTR